MFLDVLDTLQNYFLSDPDTLIWFDLFSVNQNQEVHQVDFTWWSTSFKLPIKPGYRHLATDNTRVRGVTRG